MNSRNWTPGEALRISGSYWEAFTLHCGVKLEIFSRIGDDRLSFEDLAERLQADPRGLLTLLNALTAMGLLIRENDSYGNTPFAKSFLVKDSPRYIGYMIMHHHYLIPAWTRLDQAVRSGRPVRERPHNEVERESFLMGMLNNAMAIAPGLAKELDLKDRQHLLDMGGGPGTYSVFFCLENPRLKAVVFDLATSQEYAQKTFERFRLQDRIRFQPGDYLHDRIEGTYDCAWLSHILHALGPDQCRLIIQKAVRALEPGGIIMIHDFVLDEGLDGPLFPALFALNMLVNTEEGRSYSESQIRDMLKGAGAKEIRRLPFRGPTDSGIIVGRV